MVRWKLMNIGGCKCWPLFPSLSELKRWYITGRSTSVALVIMCRGRGFGGGEKRIRYRYLIWSNKHKYNTSSDATCLSCLYHCRHYLSNLKYAFSLHFFLQLVYLEEINFCECEIVLVTDYSYSFWIVLDCKYKKKKKHENLLHVTNITEYFQWFLIYLIFY
jgi:hypothetical protein